MHRKRRPWHPSHTLVVTSCFSTPNMSALAHGPLPSPWQQATGIRGAHSVCTRRTELFGISGRGFHLPLPCAGIDPYGMHVPRATVPLSTPPSCVENLTQLLAHWPQFSSNLLCKHPAFVADKKKGNVEAIRCEPLDVEGKPMPAPKKAPPVRAQTPPPSSAPASGVPDDARAQSSGNEDANADRHAVRFDVGQCFLHHKCVLPLALQLRAKSEVVCL